MFEEVIAFFYKHCKIMQRWKGELAWLLVYPLIGVVSLGIFASFIISSGGPVESLYFVIVGVVAWNFFAVAQRAVSYGLLFEIWNECVRHLFLSKATLKDFIIGNGLFGFVSSFIGFLIIASVAFFAFNFNIFNAGMVLFIALIGILLHAITEALLICSLLLRRSTEYMSLTWILPGFVMIFSGVYYPVSALPQSLQIVSYLLPTTYAISAIRNALFSMQQAAVTDILYSIVLGVLYLSVSIYIYKKSIDKSKETGVLTNMDE